MIGRNEGGRLISCLASLRSKLETVVYVDSNSTDCSVEAAEQLGAFVISLDVDQPFTAARARNEGYAALRKLRPCIRYVQFVDGDCELDDAWLNTAVDFMARENDVAVVCGRRRERYPAASVYNYLCDVEWDTPIGSASACGGDSMMRADAFEAVNGFNAQLIAGEEPELCLRLRERGWKIWRLDAEMTRHDAAMMRFGQWWTRTVRWGYALAEVSLLHWYSPLAIWKSELARAIFWGVGLPVLIGLMTLIRPVALVAVLIYPFQISRLAIARGSTSFSSWTYASFLTLSKFAEVHGILKFLWRRIRRPSIKLIEYK